MIFKHGFKKFLKFFIISLICVSSFCIEIRFLALGVVVELFFVLFFRHKKSGNGRPDLKGNAQIKKILNFDIPIVIDIKKVSL